MIKKLFLLAVLCSASNLMIAMDDEIIVTLDGDSYNDELSCSPRHFAWALGTAGASSQVKASAEKQKSSQEESVTAVAVATAYKGFGGELGYCHIGESSHCFVCKKSPHQMRIERAKAEAELEARKKLAKLENEEAAKKTASKTASKGAQTTSTALTTMAATAAVAAPSVRTIVAMAQDKVNLAKIIDGLDKSTSPTIETGTLTDQAVLTQSTTKK